MEHFQDAIRRSLEAKNWFSALAIALAMPDICGKLETPEVDTRVRYPRWFDHYVSQYYRFPQPDDGQLRTYVTGGDCYALRCAYLHEGSLDLDGHRARQAVSAFRFIEPPEGRLTMHCNELDNKLQLQVDIFCKDMLNAVARWTKDVIDDAATQGRISQLAKIESLKNGGGI